MSKEYDLSKIDEKYRHIVKVLLSYEDVMTDGFKYYAYDLHPELSDKEHDFVLDMLVDIAKDILGEKDEDLLAV